MQADNLFLRSLHSFLLDSRCLSVLHLRTHPSGFALFCGLAIVPIPSSSLGSALTHHLGFVSGEFSWGFWVLFTPSVVWGAELEAQCFGVAVTQCFGVAVIQSNRVGKMMAVGGRRDAVVVVSEAKVEIYRFYAFSRSGYHPLFVVLHSDWGSTVGLLRGVDGVDWSNYRCHFSSFWWLTVFVDWFEGGGWKFAGWACGGLGVLVCFLIFVVLF